MAEFYNNTALISGVDANIGPEDDTFFHHHTMLEIAENIDVSFPIISRSYTPIFDRYFFEVETTIHLEDGRTMLYWSGKKTGALKFIRTIILLTSRLEKKCTVSPETISFLGC